MGRPEGERGYTAMSRAIACCSFKTDKSPFGEGLLEVYEIKAGDAQEGRRLYFNWYDNGDVLVGLTAIHRRNRNAPNGPSNPINVPITIEPTASTIIAIRNARMETPCAARSVSPPSITIADAMHINSMKSSE
jgi:hypothetical protein